MVPIPLDNTSRDENPEWRTGNDISAVVADVDVLSLYCRNLLSTLNPHRRSPRPHDRVKIFPIVMNQEQSLVGGNAVITQSVMLEKAQQVSKRRGVWLDAYKMPRQTFSERNIWGTNFTTLDDVRELRITVMAMLIGMFGVKDDELQHCSTEMIGIYEDMEFGHVDEEGVRDAPYLLLAVLVTTKIGDVGNTLIDRKDPCGRKWLQLRQEEVAGMEDIQFEPRMGQHAIIKAFEKLEQ